MSETPTAQVRQMVPPFEVLQAWAEIAAFGGLKGWRAAPIGGTMDGCDFHQSCYLHVEGFFRLAKLGTYRELQKRLMLEGRDPTMRETPDAYYFAMRYRRWYRRNPITILKKLEDA